MKATLDFSFAHAWNAEILAGRPPILPTRHFTYPAEVEEVERGALEVMVRPDKSGTQPFLATCALGFRDPVVPTGIWSMPNPLEMCAVSGGYAYMIDTSQPERFALLRFRPVLSVVPAIEVKLMLFVGHRTLLAWGERGEAWESARLSDEGVTITSVQDGVLQGMGWNMITDKETPFRLDLESGELRNSDGR